MCERHKSNRQADGFDAGETIDAIIITGVEWKRNAKPVRYSVPELHEANRSGHGVKEAKPKRWRVVHSLSEMQGVRIYSAGWFE